MILSSDYDDKSNITYYLAAGSNTGTRILCIDAHVCIEKIDYKTGTLFLYSKSTGAFYVGIGFFSIRSAE